MAEALAGLVFVAVLVCYAVDGVAALDDWWARRRALRADASTSVGGNGHSVVQVVEVVCRDRGCVFCYGERWGR